MKLTRIALIALMLAALLSGCAHDTAARGEMGVLDDAPVSETQPVATRSMDHLETSHWVAMIASVERRLERQLDEGSLNDDDLFSIKVRMLELVDDALTYYSAFPKDLDMDLRRVIALIDRALVSYRDPNAVSVLEVPMYDDDVSTTGKRPFQFIWPLTKLEITSGYGYRRDPFSGQIKFHNALDLAAEQGTLVFAAERGRVIFAGWRGQAGLVVIIDHMNGFKTFYAHLSRILTVKGLRIERGQPIGTVGNTGRSTGSHLHFKVSHHDKSVDPDRFMGATLD
jgi:murein DD-endopeptidase MepM/ murein hydrolase activator NlpD